jgi:hypothetical protein
MPEQPTVLVAFVDESRGRRIQARVSTFINVKALLIVVLRRLGFCLLSRGGQPLLYALYHRQRGRFLTAYENMLAARVRDGDTLEIMSVFKALGEPADEFFDLSDAPVMIGDEALVVLAEEVRTPQPRPFRPAES